MNERSTLSMLQRVPVILAVTAASYGLQLSQAAGRSGGQPPGKAASATQRAGQPATAAGQHPQGTPAHA